MATTTRQRYLLLAALCTAAAPVLAHSTGPQNLQLPAGIAGTACGVTDPSDPQQILAPNPAHMARADCLASLYVPLTTVGDTAADPGQPLPAPPRSTSSWSLTGTLCMYLVGIAMLVLAGFNSRKRHRHLPTTDISGSFTPPARHPHRREASRWHED